jgi:phosphoenolpyruvate carboxykinase (GTP)
MDITSQGDGGHVRHAGLKAWVEEMAAHCRPDNIYWCDGSDAERVEICESMVARGSLIRLNQQKRPGCYLAHTHPSDVARLEDRTFICAKSSEEAGPNNHWADPAQMKETLRGLFAGCMRGRTMFVLPFAMGPLESPVCKIGVQLTDSAYVAVNMQIMTRMGDCVLEKLAAEAKFVPCLHSVGAPLDPGELDVPWPCQTDASKKYVAHFPDDPAIWCFGSGYGGNALLGKKCLALRIASVMARDEGWLAEHMLIMGLTDPAGKKYYLAAAFPSACGKTNLAMMKPSLPGWKLTCLGDDIAWIRLGADGRLYAVNPETGFFGVAPNTSIKTNPNAIATSSRNTIFTNVLMTPDGDVWWEGMGVPAPAHGIDWQGNSWTPESGRPGAHANSRFTSPVAQCPVVDPDWENPKGVPLTAILFGGRRPATIPLVNEAFSWEHGVFLGSSCGSETTAAAAGAQGVLRRDPFAMLPFCGYNMADYFAHWLSLPSRTSREKLPKVYFVNWFRKGSDGKWLWPGYGENIRVLKWICERAEGLGKFKRTPIGNLPTTDALDHAGISLAPGAMEKLVAFDAEGWKNEIQYISSFYEKFERKIPQPLCAELAHLTHFLEKQARPDGAA